MNRAASLTVVWRILRRRISEKRRSTCSSAVDWRRAGAGFFWLWRAAISRRMSGWPCRLWLNSSLSSSAILSSFRALSSRRADTSSSTAARRSRTSERRDRRAGETSKGISSTDGIESGDIWVHQTEMSLSGGRGFMISLFSSYLGFFFGLYME